MRVAYTVLLSASTLLIIVSVSVIYMEFASRREDATSTPPRTTNATATIPTTQTPSSICPPGGVWSEWTVTGHCPTTCGGCSVASRVRTCVKSCGDCPCTGSSVDVGPCGLALCPFPSPGGTCCKPFKKSANYQTQEFFCGTGNIPGITEIKCHA